MRAAKYFADSLIGESGSIPDIQRIQLDFYGSLGSTGPGHGTGFAALCGLAGWTPATMDVERARREINERLGRHVIHVNGIGEVPFERHRDLRFRPEPGDTGHPNEMSFAAHTPTQSVTSTWLSTGGGFLQRVDGTPVDTGPLRPARYPFRTAADLSSQCDGTGRSIAAVMAINEFSWHGRAAVEDHLNSVRRIMNRCIEDGLASKAASELPGGLGVVRRAPGLREKLVAAEARGEPVESMEWIGLWALAVCEQNAAGGRIVTAPTNGAAGVIPALLRFAEERLNATAELVNDYLLTAAAIGSILKETSAISGAQIGCQGEIGSASAMAAAGVAAVLGGSPNQVLNAAEIALEHHLGLTCDPVAGLVQVPCIERNAVGAVKALQAARLAMRGDGTHRVSFDEAIDAMNAIGRDMSNKYKETSMGGLALSVTVC